MLAYVVRRLALSLPTLLAVSLIAFALIRLPPGDFASAYAAQLRAEGEQVDEAEINGLRTRYGLDQPFLVQYTRWIGGILTSNDWGQSLGWRRPVQEVIGERIGLSMLLAITSITLGWAIATLAAVYASTHRGSLLDSLLTLLSFVAVGTPGFLLALIALWIGFAVWGVNLGGLFSERFLRAPWSWARVGDLLAHIWLPLLILTIGSAARDTRLIRATLLDELEQPYIEAARARGLSLRRVVWGYGLRVALSPVLSTAGWSLAGRVSDEALVALVLGLQTTAPVLLQALLLQDMYLAAGIILLLGLLTVVGTLCSDVLLAWADPRIRLEH